MHERSTECLASLFQMFLTESTVLSRNKTETNVNIPGPPRFMKMNEIPVMLTP